MFIKSRMDPLSDILNLLSAKSYTTSGLMAPSGWGLHYPGFDGLKFFAVQKGTALFRADSSEEWITLKQGDGIILTRACSFSVTTWDGTVSAESEDTPFVLKEGIADYGGDALIMIAGKMEIDRTSADLLTRELPDVIRIHSDENRASVFTWLMDYIRAEKMSELPGTAIVTDHLMHLMMIEGIRRGVAQTVDTRQGWLNGLRDPRIVRALRVMHQKPGDPWRLPQLAEIAGMSRAGFVRRFSQLTGTTPLNYLTEWRMRIASKTLRTSLTPIKIIGFSLGYGSESAFSTAFKRIYGCSPAEHRRRSS